MSRALALIGSLSLALMLGACGESHSPGGSDGGGTIRRDGGGTTTRDGGGTILRDGGGTIIRDGRVIRPGEDAEPPPIDILEECISACDHLSGCSAAFPRLDCIDNCLSVRDSLPTVHCEWLIADIFSCIRGLPCSEVREDLSHTVCAGFLNEFEDFCSSDMPPTPAPGG